MTVVPIYDEPEAQQQQESWERTHHLTRSSLIVVTIFGVVAALVVFIFSLIYVIRQRRNGHTFVSWVRDIACLKRNPKTQGQACRQQKSEDPEKAVGGMQTAWGAEVCVICMERIEAEQHVSSLDCEHVFHSRCLGSWERLGRRNCPLCRSYSVA